MTAQQAKGIRQVMAGIVESAIAGGELGAPSGVVYSALMAHGCTLNQFQSLTASMVKAGIIEERGHCFHVTQRGRDWLEVVNGKYSGVQS